MNKVVTLAELKRKAKRAVKRANAHRKQKAERKTKAETHTAISKNVGNYFMAVTKTGLMPHNTKAGTTYQVEAGMKGIIYKLPPTVTHEIREGDVNTHGYGKPQKRHKIHVMQRYWFYITYGLPIQSVKQLETCKRYKVKLGEICVNFEKNKVELK